MLISFIVFTALILSSNILLDHNFVAKLGDFGFARTKPITEGSRSFWKCEDTCGTKGYMAPEVAVGEVGPKVDVYSFGIVGELTYLCMYSVAKNVACSIYIIQVVLKVFSELPAYDSRRPQYQQTIVSLASCLGFSINK